MAALPRAEDRQFVAELNQLSKDHSSATFGSPGRLVISKARRQLAFASSAWMRWPDLGGGDLRTASVEDWRMSKVDPDCSFWQAGQQRYLAALTSYMDALRSLSIDGEVQRELLAELGVHVVEDFLSEEEEKELIDYWGPGSPVFPFGTDEQISGRRWFNYGPILPRATSGTTKSTLTVIPARLGEMPPVVLKQRLKERVRDIAERLIGKQDHPALARQYDFDQMYVNYYDAANKANIEFHHDNHTCMLGAIGGVSLLSSCDLQLRPLDPTVVRPPLRITLPRRSLFFMSGLSRWHLQHAILHMPESRLSLTFRTVDRSCCRDKELWEQGWDCLEAEEAENAIWPLVRPDGQELHRLFATPEEAASLAGGRTQSGGSSAAGGTAAVAEGARRVPRRSTVVTAEDREQQQQRQQGQRGYVAPASLSTPTPTPTEPSRPAAVELAGGPRSLYGVSRSAPAAPAPSGGADAPAATVEEHAVAATAPTPAFTQPPPPPPLAGAASGGAAAGGGKQGFYPRQRTAAEGVARFEPVPLLREAGGGVADLPARSSYYGFRRARAA